MLFGLLVFGAIVFAVFSLAATYNSLVAAAERTTRAWTDLDALLRQRHDEIPKLIETCEPHLREDRAAFDRVLEARSAVLGARQTRAAEALGLAERSLRTAVTDVIARAAGHPELAASPAFGLVRQRHATLDSEIAERRERYNEAVRQYNAAVARIPGKIVALLGGFRSMRPLDVGPTADSH
jgi:LemA protein